MGQQNRRQQNNKRRRSSRPKNSRRRDAFVDDALAVFDGVCREMLATQGRRVLASGDPLQAEMWISELLGLFGCLPLVDEPDPAEAIGGRLISVARQGRTPEAQVASGGWRWSLVAS